MLPLGQFDYKKAVASISYLTRKNGGTIDKLKLAKLLFFADKLHIREYGTPIFNDTYFAVKNGPIPSGALDIANLDPAWLDTEQIDYASEFLHKEGPESFEIRSGEKGPDLEMLSVSDVKALDKVFETFGAFNSGDLVVISHAYPEWHKYEEILKSGSSGRIRISYLDFLENPPKTAVGEGLFRESPQELESAKYWLLENVNVADAFV
jgi:uncharacterized phage-associated protein